MNPRRSKLFSNINIIYIIDVSTELLTSVIKVTEVNCRSFVSFQYTDSTFQWYVFIIGLSCLAPLLTIFHGG